MLVVCPSNDRGKSTISIGSVYFYYSWSRRGQPVATWVKQQKTDFPVCESEMTANLCMKSGSILNRYNHVIISCRPLQHELVSQTM